MTSFNPRQPGYWQPVLPETHGEAPEPVREKNLQLLNHACEIQRMKAYAGLHRFQAPVADDFERGMLAPGQDLVSKPNSLAQFRGALASVILGLRTRCIGQKPDDGPVVKAPKLD
jgi:hypothetical protein